MPLSGRGALNMTHVLVIDDDKSVCLSLEIWLRLQGCVATLANSGRLGIETFEHYPFDLVMVDIFMPGMDGIETIKRFRARAPGVPIIAMSGFTFREFLLRRRAGFSRHGGQARRHLLPAQAVRAAAVEDRDQGVSRTGGASSGGERRPGRVATIFRKFVRSGTIAPRFR